MRKHLRAAMCRAGLHAWEPIPGLAVCHCSPCGRVRRRTLIDFGRAKVWLTDAAILFVAASCLFAAFAIAVDQRSARQTAADLRGVASQEVRA